MLFVSLKNSMADERLLIHLSHLMLEKLLFAIKPLVSIKVEGKKPNPNYPNNFRLSVNY